MNSSRTQHLTEEQFAGYMVGDVADAAAAAHLSVCDECRSEVENFGASVQSFNLASMAWSESRPSTSLRVRTSSRAAWRLHPGMTVASWGFATGVLLMSAIPLARHLKHPSRETAPAVLSAQESQKQIEQDNQLLMAVDRELSEQVTSPEQEYGLDKELPQDRQLNSHKRAAKVQ
ncbi:hypothetical protein [Terriglobus saanensis]|uniref:Zinc-finger domain-containing protein n=1 Tax=Terriglobus saanensis (strain ATCC BAA-1853 / DSM 23119 / SP1PR4) TaxID=401053 RepID=E8V0K9_TERSS|nr:hypothetical protein [Terriglobus saanensis]ADV81072.1 hypothetical protein AciPR4_0234 [Terriglobus saanensis SP1PR4]